jgi:hypothetical protein
MRFSVSDNHSPRGHVVVNDDSYKIALYFPEDVGSEGVTVYWHGDVTKDHLVSTLRVAENAWRTKSGAPKETLFVYGTAKETFKYPAQDVPQGARKLSEQTFDACRVELCSSKGKLILWANIVPGDTVRPLEQGGENIGLAFPLRQFDSNARAVVTHALVQTLPLGQEAADRIMGQVHRQLHSAPHFA